MPFVNNHLIENIFNKVLFDNSDCFLVCYFGGTGDNKFIKLQYLIKCR